MKKTILILLIIGGITTAGSFQVGRVIEAELPAILTRVANLGQMQIEITNYQRKLFRSEVDTTITLASISGSLEQLHLNHQIWHGPFPFGKSSNGQWQFIPMSALVETRVDRDNPPSGLIGTAFKTFPELYNAIDLTGFDFAGNGTSNHSIPGFNKAVGSGTEELTIAWQGIHGRTVIDKSIKSIKGEIDIPAISIFSETSRLETENIKSSYRIFEDYGGLLLGDVTMDTAAINLSRSRARTELRDIQFRNAARLHEDTVSYSIAIGFEQATSAGQSYGPGGFEIDFTNLDATAIRAVQKQLQTIQSKMKKLSEEEIRTRIIAIYAKALPALMKKTPEIKLNYLNMSGPGGEFWSKGNILLENPTGTKIKDMNALLGTLRANIDSQISKPLAQNLLTTLIKGQLASARAAGQLGDIDDDRFDVMATEAAEEQLSKLVADGALVDEGGNYRAKLTYINRATTLNGQPFK